MRLLRAFRRRLSGRGSDRGASAVELAILGPALIIVSLLIVQFALWLEATHAALAIAQEGDRAARETAFTSSPGGVIAPGGRWSVTAREIAESYYRGMHVTVLGDMNAQPRVGAGNTVSVTVTGKVNGIFPLTVSETVSGPVECLRAAQGVNCAAPAAG